MASDEMIRMLGKSVTQARHQGARQGLGRAARAWALASTAWVAFLAHAVTEGPESAVGADQQGGPRLMLYICGGLVLAAFALMFYAIWRHRRSKAADFHKSATVELIWALIPVLIVVGLAYPAVKAILTQRGADRVEGPVHDWRNKPDQAVRSPERQAASK